MDFEAVETALRDGSREVVRAAIERRRDADRSNEDAKSECGCGEDPVRKGRKTTIANRFGKVLFSRPRPGRTRGAGSVAQSPNQAIPGDLQVAPASNPVRNRTRRALGRARPLRDAPNVDGGIKARDSGDSPRFCRIVFFPY